MASYTDDFNRTNNASLGAAWATMITGSIGVNSNQAKNGVSGSSQVAYGSLLVTDNHYAQFAMGTADAANGVTCRHTGTSTATMNGYLGNNQSGVRLFKYINGTFTQLGSTVSVTVTAGDIYKLTANGTTITVDVNSVNKITQTDSSVTTGKSAGIRLSGLNATIDDWAAADLTVPASLIHSDRARRNSLLRR